MFAAVEAQVRLAEGRIHVMAMMRARRVGMGEGREVATGDAEALHGNGVGVLQMPDHLDEGQQQVFLLPVAKAGDGLFDEAGAGLRGPKRGGAFCGRRDVHRAPVVFAGMLGEKAPALQSVEGIGRGRLGDAEMGCNLLDAKPAGAAPVEQSENGKLRRIETGRLRPVPVLGRTCRDAGRAGARSD